MKLFTLGPVEIYPESVTVYQKGFPYFRTPEYGNFVRRILARMAKLVGLPYADNMIYLTASGTAAMEATLENCFSSQDRLLIINGGSFGQRFCELSRYHSISFDSIDLHWGEMLAVEHLAPYTDKRYSALLVNIHETSTGQLYDIQMLKDFCRSNGMLLIVDAIGSFLADEYDMGSMGIDCTIFSSQKGLSCSPGLSFVALGEQMLRRLSNTPPQYKAASRYFDFREYLQNIPRGQTPYTPAMRIMYEIEQMLDIIEAAGGKDAWLARIQEKAVYFRRRAAELGYELPTYPLSNMLTPLCFRDVSAYDVFACLKDHYQIYVNPCGGELAERMFRVSHIGNTSLADIDDLFEKINCSLNVLRK